MRGIDNEELDSHRIFSAGTGPRFTSQVGHVRWSTKCWWMHGLQKVCRHSELSQAVRTVLLSRRNASADFHLQAVNRLHKKSCVHKKSIEMQDLHSHLSIRTSTNSYLSQSWRPAGSPCIASK